MSPEKLKARKSKTRSKVWEFFNEIYPTEDGAKVQYQCVFCQRPFCKNATQMEDHIVKTCKAAPPETKLLFVDPEEIEVLSGKTFFPSATLSDNCLFQSPLSSGVRL